MVNQIGGATLALMVLTQAALADCPGHVSDVSGLKLSRAEPFLASVFRQTPAGLTEARILSRGGVVEEVSTTYPHPLAPGERISANGRIDLDYAADPAALERLEQDGSWSSAVVLRVDGQVVLEGEAVKRLAGTEVLDIGGCSTTVWLVEDRLELGQGDGSWFMQSYAPDLGLVVRTVKMSADGQPLDGVTFDGIEVVP